jgi:uncharacterized protein (UPF0248 family)
MSNKFEIIVHYLNDDNKLRWDMIECDSLRFAEQIMNTIRERGLTIDVDVREYKNAIVLKRHIPYHRIIRVDYIELKEEI